MSPRPKRNKVPKIDKVFSPKDAKELKAHEDELARHIENAGNALGKLRDAVKKVRVRHYGAHCGWTPQK